MIFKVNFLLEGLIFFNLILLLFKSLICFGFFKLVVYMVMLIKMFFFGIYFFSIFL